MMQNKVNKLASLSTLGGQYLQNYYASLHLWYKNMTTNLNKAIIKLIFYTSTIWFNQSYDFDWNNVDFQVSRRLYLVQDKVAYHP